MFMALILSGGFFSLWVVGDLSTPILTSIVLALLFRPMQVYFTKIGVPERLSVFVTFFTAVSLATLFFLIFIPLFINEANRYLFNESLLEADKDFLLKKSKEDLLTLLTGNCSNNKIKRKLCLRY